MSDRGCGVLGNLFNCDCAILFFILIFLCLFTSYGNCCNCGCDYDCKE